MAIFFLIPLPCLIKVGVAQGHYTRQCEHYTENLFINLMVITSACTAQYYCELCNCIDSAEVNIDYSRWPQHDSAFVAVQICQRCVFVVLLLVFKTSCTYSRLPVLTAVFLIVYHGAWIISYY